MKKLNLKYFGMIAEQMGLDQEVQQLVVAHTEELRQELESRNFMLKSIPFRFAVNQVLVTENYPLNEGDEVALLPPFAGG
ncbi:MAG: MoaD/ThiS family protein [Bacteroidia bacterium]